MATGLLFVWPLRVVAATHALIVASFVAVLAYGVILYSLSFRYLNLFPQERELAAAPEV